jgi:hypothetical protein
MENISTTTSTLVSLSTGLGLFWWRYLFCSGGIISIFNGIPPPSPLDQNRTQIQCKEGGGNFSDDSLFNIIQYQSLLYRPFVLFLRAHLSKYLLCSDQH